MNMNNPIMGYTILILISVLYGYIAFDYFRDIRMVEGKQIGPVWMFLFMGTPVLVILFVAIAHPYRPVIASSSLPSPRADFANSLM